MNEDLEVVNKDLITVYRKKDGKLVVFGRDFYKKLCITEPYINWFFRIIKFRFTEPENYETIKDSEIIDHLIGIEMAKHISAMQVNTVGNRIRNRLIRLENNSCVSYIPDLTYLVKQSPTVIATGQIMI